jgi:hypothetical protein
MQKPERKTLLSLCLAAVFTACLCGCAVVGERFVFEEPLAEKQVRMIKNGETTRKEILDWFGPPLAVARPGTVLKVPLPGPIKSGSEEVKAEAFFERFSGIPGIMKDHVIYYYSGSAAVWSDLCFYNGCIPTTPSLEVRRYWILIDEHEGRVKAHALEVKEEAIKDPWSSSQKGSKNAEAAKEGRSP